MIERRGRNTIDDSALAWLRVRLRLKNANALRDFVSLPGEIGAGLLPIPPAIARLPKCVSGEEEQVRIARRKDNRLGAHHAKIIGAKCLRQNLLRLVRAAIVTGEFTSIDNVGIERIGCDITVLLRADRMPVAKGDLAVWPATVDADGTAFLLAAIKTVGK